MSRPFHLQEVIDVDDASAARRHTTTIRPSPPEGFYIEVPYMSPASKSLYKAIDEEMLAADADNQNLTEIIGENCEGSTLYYYAQSSAGFARKYTAKFIATRHSDLLTEYKHKKSEDLLGNFDPTAHYVHPEDRVRLTVTLPRPGGAKRQSVASDSGETNEDSDGYSEGGSDEFPVRRSKRKGVAESRRRDLPYSPRKTRSRLKTFSRISPTDSDAEDSESLGPRRRSTRSRKTVHGIDDEDFDMFASSEEEASPTTRTKKVRKLAAAPRPEYGSVRDVEMLHEEDAYPLHSHRSICERCHKEPASILLQQLRKKGKKRARRKKHSDEESSDDDQAFERLGGWVRCMQCCVAAHWKCLAAHQRDEILRATRLKSGEEASPRKELLVSETTDFICGSCAKEEFCMMCNDSVKLVQSTKAQITAGALDGKPLAGEPSVSEQLETLPAPPTELLFRCLTCKRVAHYDHLPQPGKEVLSASEKAVVFQQENEWGCHDCHSYTYSLDKILAWRPYPPMAKEPSREPGQMPNPKTSLPREYLVKWAERSYRRTQWVPHMWLAATNAAKLKNFLSSGTQIELLHSPGLLEPPSTADQQPFAIGNDPGMESSGDRSLRTSDPLAAKPDAESCIPTSWQTTGRVLDIILWYPQKSTPTKNVKKRTKSKQIVDSEVESDEAPNSEAEDEYRAAFDQGEEPSADYTETVDEFEARKGRKLVKDDIKRVLFGFIKWEGLTYDEASWDSPPKETDTAYVAFRAAFDRFVSVREINLPKRKKTGDRWDNRTQDGYSRHRLLEGAQPELGQDSTLKLMPFQIDGFNWLCDNWWNHQHCILADEMGLGKTVQIATFLGTIVTKWKAAPVLVVVPNSTIINWVREFERWAPNICVVPFYGEAKARKVIKDYELYHSDTGDLKFHVMVTTYETLTGQNDFSVFRSVPRWEALVVDEGQRLKGNTSLLFKKLNELNTMHRVIMTGTPLNNNIRELFNLMNFLDPDEWHDLEKLEKEHEELTEDLIKGLHTRLRPYFLRRIKSEVLSLPPKNEVIVPVSMAPLQKNIYKSILSQNVQLLQSLLRQASSSKLSATASKTNMNNILMQLRKCLQHPYLISDEIEPRGLPDGEAHSKLIDASGKLRLLKSLLPQLKIRGHRVLLFSQFAIALDILEDFMRGEGFKYLRLDGNTKQAERQKGMDEFNRENSDVFIYLLTTRAGGVGINLWSADTVIIYDPDFNPHQDLQAIARAHRFGQTKTCLVFKLMVKESAEERIMQTGKKKLALDHLIVQKMDDDDSGGQDVQSILTYGAQALFNDTETDSKDITYTDNDVEKLINKTEKEGDQLEQPKEGGGLTFAFAKVWAADRDALEDIPDVAADIPVQNDSWAQTLQRISQQREEDMVKEVTGRGARRRAAVGAYREVDVFDSPDKSHKARQKSKSIDDDADGDFIDEAASVVSQQSDNGDLDYSTPLLNELTEPLQGPPARRKKNIDRLAAGETSTHDTSIRRMKTVMDATPCGLCHTIHGERQCYMTEESENLAQYRNMLLTHTEHESWEERYAAIQVIDETLYKRGRMNLIQGQPLMLVDNRPTKTAQPSVGKPVRPSTSGSTMQPRSDLTRPIKRAPSTTLVNDMPKKKKPKPSNFCSVCGQSPHSLADCPIAADPKRVAQEITRLEKDTKHHHAVDELRKHLWRLKRQKRSGPPGSGESAQHES